MFTASPLEHRKRHLTRCQERVPFVTLLTLYFAEYDKKSINMAEYFHDKLVFILLTANTCVDKVGTVLRRCFIQNVTYVQPLPSFRLCESFVSTVTNCDLCVRIAIMVHANSSLGKCKSFRILFSFDISINIQGAKLDILKCMAERNDFSDSHQDDT